MGWIFNSKESGRVITVPSLSIAVSITIKTKEGEKKYNPIKINIPPKLKKNNGYMFPTKIFQGKSYKAYSSRAQLSKMPNSCCIKSSLGL